MKTSLQCLPCLIKQAVDSSMLITGDEEIIIDILRQVLNNLSEADLLLSPPEIAGDIQAVIRNNLSNSDPYLKIKEKSTKKAFELAPEAERLIEASKDPFATALAFAIAGNILDFAKNTSWDEDLINQRFSMAVEQASSFDPVQVKRLNDEISSAGQVLFLGDNAGEAVFDRILIQYMQGSPDVYYAVKSSPVINDVTLKEALDSGIGSCAEIIPNGADIPGTLLSRCSPEFLRIFNRADVVISKGQGNYETLSDAERKIWFLFQVKCPVISSHCGYKTGSWVIYERS